MVENLWLTFAPPQNNTWILQSNRSDSELAPKNSIAMMWSVFDGVMATVRLHYQSGCGSGPHRFLAQADAFRQTRNFD